MHEEKTPHDRSTGIGGSEIAAVAGLDPRITPLDVWLRKVPTLPDGTPNTPDRFDNEFMAVGRDLEDGIARIYSRRTGRNLITVNTFARHAARPWQIASYDRIVDGEERGVEIKNVDAHKRDLWGEPGTADAPINFVCQAQWYMNVSGFPIWDLAPLFGGNNFAVFPVSVDRDLISALIEAGDQFWREHVLTGTPPPIDYASKGAAAYLQKRFAVKPERAALREASNHVRDLAAALAENKKQAKRLKQGITVLQNQLIEELAGDHGFESKGEFKITYKKAADSKTLNVKAFMPEWRDAARSALARVTAAKDAAEAVGDAENAARFALAFEDLRALLALEAKHTAIKAGSFRFTSTGAWFKAEEEEEGGE